MRIVLEHEDIFINYLKMPSAMKIILLLPYSNSHYVVPPVNLGYLATALRKDKHEVVILDGVKDRIDQHLLAARMRHLKPDVIGISVFSCDVKTVQGYVATLRQRFPGTKIILGGPHISGVSQELYDDFPNIDYAIGGEAEIGFPMLLRNLKSGNQAGIPGLIYRKDSRVVVNPSYFEPDLDKLGLPAWDLIDPRIYPQAPQGAVFRHFPIAPMIMTRGCPYRCTYCAGKVVTGGVLRRRSLSNVMEEVALLYHKYGIRELHIIDDTFTLDRALVEGFCHELIRQRIRITYTFPNGVRLNTLDEPLLRLLKKTGCYAMSVGVESGDQRILNDMKKALTLPLIEEKIALIDRLGIDVNGFFIVGYPTENRTSIRRTIDFAKRLRLKRAHFSSFLPLPGTEITEHLKHQGVIKKLDYNRLFYSDVPYAPPGMTRRELKNLQRRAFLEFYLRPRIIWGLITEIRSWTHLKFLVKRAVDYAFGR
jgi:anaerobic magnesium-protoporphyrin IX monomethyl ester cyclase